MQFVAIIALTPLLLFNSAIYASPINFMLPKFKPFTYVEDGEFKGIGVEKVRTIMDSMDTPYNLELAPNYGRAVEELKKNRVDGMFLASENAERNKVATFSEPVVINRWSWFILKDSKLLPGNITFHSKALVASQLNTNTHKWLLKENYQVGFAPSDIDLLPWVLSKGRVDAVFLAEEVFLKSCEDLDINPDIFIQVVQIEKPFGIYIHNNYLQSHPGFMDRLNSAIHKAL
ncbi:substrate-binding periplasmic protein [Aliamphritea ceti]|uniref:substrate-binding periplasmic protein n=1 Tax=Aliamphritea ceti TaxID=1524258 RepID=UPI0021C417BE|nr:transporter substrate-binding domain-containing protein [Aliamphritea ceti]